MNRVVLLLLCCALLTACTPAEFAATERLSNVQRQQRVVWIIDRLTWTDADYLQILEAAEAVEKLSAVYTRIRETSLNLQYNQAQFDLLQGAYLMAAREYRDARSVVKRRWAEFSPEEQIVLRGWDRDAQIYSTAMNENFIAIADPATSTYTRAQLWQDTMTLMPYVLTGAEILLPLVKVAL